MEKKGLGGVMAWSLGEDTYQFAHLDAMQKGIKEAGPEQEAKTADEATSCGATN